MRVQLEARHWSQVRVGDARYLCLRQAGRLVVIRDECKHRGGPLSLGTWDEATECVTCPWHEIVNSPRDLARRQVPSVRVGGVMHILVPEPS
ncbi:Rieske 2Fe-2S domain-containing protein [[Archangium] primigenium]|jgi:nitrite reductase/ring-hydroxylating ferredoxin subunit|uniref:Rieske 2Fe-2S domain-containing protein n=1 Tax=Melittangium TaxID=44 RepID=UPI0019585662|nr:Rieske 2Fe-2S domain-containing protein [Archangium primigenium]MBM7113848.1 Rieske 2Fe-2S domain-containing protein [Archangium primigenium]